MEFENLKLEGESVRFKRPLHVSPTVRFSRDDAEKLVGCEGVQDAAVRAICNYWDAAYCGNCEGSSQDTVAVSWNPEMETFTVTGKCSS